MGQPRDIAGSRILGHMDDARLIETTIASRVVHTGRYLTVRVDTIRDADGGEHTRDVIDHPGAVAILPLDGASVLMVHQYRTPAGRVLLEIPAGTLERAPDGSVEDPVTAGPRELGEETGFRGPPTGSCWAASSPRPASPRNTCISTWPRT